MFPSVMELQIVQNAVPPTSQPERHNIFCLSPSSSFWGLKTPALSSVTLTPFKFLL
jgi:hypothetical protein